MITLYVNTAGRLVTPEGGVLPAQDRPELTAGVKYDFDVIPVAGAATGEYTLSGDIKFDRRNLMMSGTSSEVDDGTIRFRGVSTDTLGFWEKPKQPGEKLYLRLTLAADGGEISILEDHIYCRPGISGTDDHPAPNPGAITTLNGLRGKVEFYDSEGNLIRTENNALWLPEVAGPPGPEGPAGATIIADPVTEMAVADETWGDCRYLDATFRQLSFRGRVRSLRRVSLEMVSIDSGVTGNIVLVPVVNGSELSGTSFVVAVGAEPAVTTFALEVASGTLALRRDADDERDTLKDSGNTPVTAVVLSVILEVQYDA